MGEQLRLESEYREAFVAEYVASQINPTKMGGRVGTPIFWSSLVIGPEMGVALNSISFIHQWYS